MVLESIIRRPFPQADRAEVQERVAQEVERDPDKFLARYVADPRSHRGRYVNADLMKEVFDEYNESRETRSRYNLPVHNAAAVLASEQYSRTVADRSDATLTTVVFLTGIPGSGKTTYVVRGGEFPNDYRCLYEGQLANPEAAIPKIAQALAEGLRVQIRVVHIQAQQALLNALSRFELLGRGVTIEAMASIQGRLPFGLRAVKAYFGDNAIDFRIADRRATIETELRGWQYLPELESEGSYEHIKQRLTGILESEYGSARISEEAYIEALGRPPRDQG